MAGKKYDNGKPQYDLIDPDFEEGLACVLTHGAFKYGRGNWKEIQPERYIAALRRHFKSFFSAFLSKGNELKHIDQDTQLLHIDSMVACLMFLRWNILKSSPMLSKKLTFSIANQKYIPEVKNENTDI
jgi:hypothetical protein